MKPIFRMKGELKVRDSNQNIITYLTFSGNAKEAMNFYVSIFPDSKILELTRIGENDCGEKGKVLKNTMNKYQKIQYLLFQFYYSAVYFYEYYLSLIWF